MNIEQLEYIIKVAEVNPRFPLHQKASISPNSGISMAITSLEKELGVLKNLQEVKVRNHTYRRRKGNHPESS